MKRIEIRERKEWEKKVRSVLKGARGVRAPNGGIFRKGSESRMLYTNYIRDVMERLRSFYSKQSLGGL